MRVALYGRHIETKGFKSFFQNFTQLLSIHHIDYEVSTSYGEFLKKTYDITCNYCADTDLTPEHFTCLISLGGDGTALDTLSLLKDSGLPLMGINLGRLGFLANIKMEGVEDAILALKNGETVIEERALLEIQSDIPELNQFPYALNDFVVQKRDSSAMITVKASLNGSFLNNYWADGLIISTPTGSSGYSLSCGGPLIFPGSKSFVITPIAAHNLTVRPIVIPDTQVLEIETQSRADTVLITLDSRSFVVPHNTRLTLRRATFDFIMLQLKGTTYMDTIRNKLLWGADRRDGV
ncbi:NAD kinase [Bacteroidia bacterium]|jgi:NAD+ kinase|nr:NAD kinase [Bacteroidota bacterium]MDA8929865.1 NAD kinase [Bacteroidia bacterium]MDB4173241.1 NAD kinase [Bacteroidia bacterium]